MAAYRRPAEGNRIAALPRYTRFRDRPPAGAAKGIPISFKTVNRSIDVKSRVMIVPHTIFRFVIGCGTRHLYLAGGEVSLKITHILQCVP